MAGRCFEAHHRLGLRSRPHPRDILAQLRDSARIPGRAHLVEQACRRELGVHGQSVGDDRDVAIELRRARDRGAAERGVEIALELTSLDPVVHDASTYAQALGDRGFVEAFVQ
jgi:hypothetical protein